VLQGSAQAVFPLSMSIVADEWDAVRRRVGIGWLSASLAMGAALGTVAAGVITQVVHDYHVVFWAATVISIGAGFAVMLTVPPSPSESRGRVDVAGAALMTAWLTVFLLGVAQLGQRGFADVQSLLLVAIGVALLVAWLRLERRVRQPLVDPRQLFMPSVLSANLMAFFIGFGVYGPLFLVTELVQAPASSGYGFGLSVLSTGLIMLPGTVGSFFGSQLAGHARVPARTMVQAGAVVLSISLVGTALWHGALWQLVLFNGMTGIGGALGFTCLPAIIIDAVPASDTGVATGINTIMRTISGSVAGAVLGGLLGAGRNPANTAYLAAFMLCGVVVAAALPLSALGRRAGEKPLAVAAPNAAPATTARR
jgi:MFS family permease